MRTDAAVSVALRPLALAACLVAAAALIQAVDLARLAPPSRWLAAAFDPSPGDIREAIAHYALLPRAAMALLCGFALGLAGALFQQILRNPLAEPATLGATSGAYLAIAIATFYAPAQLAAFREGVSLAGAAAATACVFFFAWTETLSPVRLILAGLVVNLTCAAAATMLALSHDQGISSLYVWASGSLVQHDWSSVRTLLPQIALLAAAALTLIRPLSLIGLGDATASGLGLSPRNIRLLGLALAVSLGAFTVSAVGAIAFVGLAAPALARLSGARGPLRQLIWSALIGAGLLWLADGLAARVVLGAQQLPAGAVTALIGAPLIVLLLPRHGLRESPLGADRAAPARMRHPRLALTICLLAAPVVLWAALSFGRTLDGWRWSAGPDFEALLFWRWPRVFASFGAGAMLAAAGCLMQRVTGNDMASPEALGIGSGAVFAVILAMLAGAPFSPPVQFGAALAGAVAAFLLVIGLSARGAFHGPRLLLVGVGLNTALAAITAWFVGGGDPRALFLLRWMAGSTALIREPMAIAALCAAAVLIGLAAPFVRWLDILPLGGPTARAVGAPLRRSRLALLLLSASLTAAGTLIVGPLSFVGLMGPHLAAMSGLTRPLHRLVGSALIGGCLMVAGDWIGRVALFPNELPAALAVTLIGAPYFLLLLRRRAG